MVEGWRGAHGDRLSRAISQRTRETPGRAAAVWQLAEERARATRNPALLAKAKTVGGTIGALKRFLLDDIIRERNAFAEAVMKAVEQRREEMKATGTK